MRTRDLLLLAATIAAGGAGAAERPTLVPSREATVEYEVQGRPSDRPLPVRVHFSGGKIRAEPAGIPGYFIVDRGLDRAIMVMGAQHIYLEVPLNSGLTRDFLPNDRMTYSKGGDARVAGLACTIWEITTPEGRTAQACVTADGLVLRGEGHDPVYGSGRAEAVSVEYGPQPANLFQPPSGFQRIPIPSLPGSMPGALETEPPR